MAASYDSIIIGGGHNGLVCAAYLARAGQRVLVLEAAPQVGGAAITRQFAPGFQVSAGAHLLHMMPQSIMRDLALASHGLRMAATAIPSWALVSNDTAIRIGAGVPGSEPAAYAAFDKRLRHLAASLNPILNMVPPRLGTGNMNDRLALLRLGWKIRSLGKSALRDLLRIIGMNVYDLLEENFESDPIKGAVAFDAVLGTNFGPRSPGTVLTLLMRMAAQAGAGADGLMQPQGGMGAVSTALASAAQRNGTEIRTGQRVKRISVHDDTANGIILDSGETIQARAVISNADPKSTFLGLLGTAYLDTGFVRRVSHMRSHGLTAKLHLALSAMPEFSFLPASAHGDRLIIAPGMAYIERAYNHAKYREYSLAPAMELTIPTVNDPQLAPAGQHVVSAIIQYAPYAPDKGWNTAKNPFLDRIMATLAAYAPALPSHVIAAELLTPQDIESEFGMSGGHWHHGDLAFDQIFMMRPVPGAGQYITQLPGLFLCGAGSHPGGGVMGIAGRNAAAQVLKCVA